MQTFASFVISESSQAAFAAAVDVAQDSQRAINPLFLVGPVGSGKSHLLQAIVHAIRSGRPDARIAASESLCDAPAVELGYPDVNGRVEIARRAAADRSLRLPAQTLRCLAEQLTGTPRALQSAIARIAAEASSRGSGGT